MMKIYEVKYLTKSYDPFCPEKPMMISTRCELNLWAEDILDAIGFAEKQAEKLGGDMVDIYSVKCIDKEA